MRTVTGCQVLVSYVNSFFFTHSNSFKDCDVILIIICLHRVTGLNSSFWPIDGTLTGSTTPGQSGPGSKRQRGTPHSPKDIGLTPHHQMQLSALRMRFVVGVIPM